MRLEGPYRTDRLCYSSRRNSQNRAITTEIANRVLSLTSMLRRLWSQRGTRRSGVPAIGRCANLTA